MIAHGHPFWRTNHSFCQALQLTEAETVLTVFLTASHGSEHLFTTYMAQWRCGKCVYECVYMLWVWVSSTCWCMSAGACISDCVRSIGVYVMVWVWQPCVLWACMVMCECIREYVHVCMCQSVGKCVSIWWCECESHVCYECAWWWVSVYVSMCVLQSVSDCVCVYMSLPLNLCHSCAAAQTAEKL